MPTISLGGLALVAAALLGLNGLFASATNLARVPILLAALLVARGLPAHVYRSITTGMSELVSFAPCPSS